LADDFKLSVRAVAQKVKPAVVQITVEQLQLDQFNQPFSIPAGVGSGVIYDKQGYILTNNHVVEDARQLLVTLPDGRSFEGKLLGRDPQTDLAVVQITADNLPVAPLGDSSSLQVGDWVVAIGNALGLPGGPTVTAGVVSALGRTVQEPGSSRGPGPFLFDVIQTDAAINPGNSGGPLLNLDGEVIGINTLVAGGSANIPAQGIGFALAINTVKPIANDLVTKGRAFHPFLGVSYVPLTPAVAAQIGATEKSGVLVGRVTGGSPAFAAGVQANDIILAIDGVTLTDESSLARAIDARKIGDTITLTIVRSGSRLTLQATLAERPSQ
jgi:S1-C subfamily serine protease